MPNVSLHFDQRRRQRGLRRDVLSFILEFAEIRFAMGATWLVVCRSKLPLHLKDTSVAKRAAQWLIIMKDGVLITCYRAAKSTRNVIRSS